MCSIHSKANYQREEEHWYARLAHGTAHRTGKPRAMNSFGALSSRVHFLEVATKLAHNTGKLEKVTISQSCIEL